MAKWHADADKDFRENPDMLRDHRSYEFERSYQQDSAIQGYVSIVRADAVCGFGVGVGGGVGTAAMPANVNSIVAPKS